MHEFMCYVLFPIHLEAKVGRDIPDGICKDIRNENECSVWVEGRAGTVLAVRGRGYRVWGICNAVREGDDRMCGDSKRSIKDFPVGFGILF